MMTAEKPDKEFLKLILASRPQVNLADNAGRTALMYAAMRGHKDNAKLILNAGADAALVDKRGKTAYDIAQENRHNDTASAVKPKKPKDKD
jgi:ankyrin repeat protein